MVTIPGCINWKQTPIGSSGEYLANVLKGGSDKELLCEKAEF
jgi:hypothetical protein